jgi:ribosome-binding factor A
MSRHRIERINSLLQQVLSEVIMRDVKDPRLPPLVGVSRVDTSADLHHATVYISVIGKEENKSLAMEVLKDAAGYIAVLASKKVVLRYFPSLSFKLDTSIEKHLRIDELLSKIHEEKNTRRIDAPHDESSP